MNLQRLPGPALGLVLALGWCGSALGQATPEALAAGIQAYRDLEFDSAAARLRGVLELSGADALGDADRGRALVYLGATELFRERRDSAAAAFRRLLTMDPRFRPDQLIFPPEVLTLFEQVRLGTRVVLASVPPRTELAGGARLVIRLYAASYHEMTAHVARAAGEPFRTLYSGGIGDSLEVLWDGRDSTGVPADSGRYLLRVVSREAGGRIARTYDLPLDVQTTRRDTLAHPAPPADSLMLPEIAPRGSPAGALLLGMVAAGAAAALPALVADGARGSAARYGVAATIGAAGIAGYVVQRRPAPIPENVAANQASRRAWERELADVTAENRRRLADARLVILAGQPAAGEPR